MSSNQPTKETKEPSLFSQPWGTTWRKAIVSLPRLVPDAALRFISPDGPHPTVIKIPSRSKHQIPLYVFIPPTVTNTTNPPPLPVILDFHGGGFVFGSCQEQAPFCAKLSRDLNALVISVDYRLGPYASFPAAIEDAEDVLNAILDPSSPSYTSLRNSINSSLARPSKSKPTSSFPAPTTITIDTTRLALSGFSSGGSLIYNLALSTPPTQPYTSTPWPAALPPSHTHPVPLLMFYPALDTRLRSNQRPLPPGTDPPRGFLANLNLEADLMPTYLPSEMTGHPRASPCVVSLAEGALHRSVKMLVVLPEVDPITAQSRVWIERVRAEGRGEDVEVVDVQGMGHGWTQFPDQWLEERARRLKGEVFERAVSFTREVWGPA